MYEDRGSKRSPNKVQQAVKMRLGPHFRGPGVAMWPHPIGRDLWFDDLPVSSAGFLISASGFWRNNLWLLASTAWFGTIHFNQFQPLLFAKICPDSQILNLFWIKSEFDGLLGSFLFRIL